MAGSGFELDDRAFLASLLQASERIQRAGETANEHAADQIIESARQKAPVLTGRLRDSIHRGPTRRSLEGAELEVVADAPYAGFVEFGTSTNTAEPYMRPAVEETVSRVKVIVPRHI